MNHTMAAKSKLCLANIWVGMTQCPNYFWPIEVNNNHQCPFHVRQIISWTQALRGHLVVAGIQSHNSPKPNLRWQVWRDRGSNITILWPVMQRMLRTEVCSVSAQQKHYQSARQHTREAASVLAFTVKGLFGLLKWEYRNHRGSKEGQPPFHEKSQSLCNASFFTLWANQFLKQKIEILWFQYQNLGLRSWS